MQEVFPFGKLEPSNSWLNGNGYSKVYLEKCLLIDSAFHYSEQISKLINKSADLVFQFEQTNWLFLPHFADENQNKPNEVGAGFYAATRCTGTT